MDDFWRQRMRFTCIGLGHLTIGAGIVMLAVSNAEHSIWSLPQFAFGGALVTQGVLHLSAAWDIQPPPPGNGIARVGIPRAPNEQGVQELEDDGLILHQNSTVIVERKNDVGKANLENVGEVEPANVVGEARPANFVGEEGQVDVGQDPVAGDIVGEADKKIDAGEVDPANPLEEVGLENNAEESGQVSNVVELGQDNDASEPANVVNESGLPKDVDEADPSNLVGQASMDEVNQVESVDDIAGCPDKDDSTDVFESEIELPRSFIGLSLDVPSIKFIDSSESECE